MEKRFERLLVASRWLVLVPVLALLVGAAYFAYLSVYEVIHGLTAADTSEGLSLMLQAVDAGLLCAIFIIVSLGLYELFISHLEGADSKPLASVLEVASLDDLKDKLGKAILLVLIIRFFDFVANLQLTESLDLLAYAGGVALLALALYLSREGSEKKADKPDEKKAAETLEPHSSKASETAKVPDA